MRRALAGACIGAYLLAQGAAMGAHYAHHAPMAGQATAMGACTEEDGSTPGQAFPCVWAGSATTVGNGTGDIYVLAEPAGPGSGYDLPPTGWAYTHCTTQGRGMTMPTCGVLTRNV